jgi:hypothetical protein
LDDLTLFLTFLGVITRVPFFLLLAALRLAIVVFFDII